MKPNIVVFRMPDENGVKMFLEVGMDEHGTLIPEPAYKFQPNPGDSFNEMGFDELAVIYHNDETKEIIELARVNLVPIGGKPVIIHQEFDMLQIAVHTLMKDYYTDRFPPDGESIH